MSYEQNYFPPCGTKLAWGHKSLRYSPWYCGILCELVRLGEIPENRWPASVRANVDLIDGKFKWTVEIHDWRNGKKTIVGKSKDALKACLKAEEVGIKEAKDLFPDYVVKALENGWRPPAGATTTLY